MKGNGKTGAERDQRLQSVLVAYLEAAECGQPSSLEELQDRYPEFAAELAEFLGNRFEINRLAGPMRSLAEKARAQAEARSNAATVAGISP
ncbi:MAG: hypothetical protein ACREFP_23265 [Acetobacteraceae bacterium]